MSARFVVKRDKTGKYRFIIVSSNGQILVTSEPYMRKATCLAGIQALKNFASNAAVQDETADE